MALLAYLAALAKVGVQATGAQGLALALLLFIMGVLLGGLATGTTYLATYRASENPRSFLVWNTFSICLVLSSYLAFVAGGLAAYFAS